MRRSVHDPQRGVRPPRAARRADHGLGAAGDPALRIVDCGPLKAYRRAHLPGAVGLPVHHWLKDPADPLHVLGPEPFAVMGSLGISADTTVVAYDDAGGPLAARLWWALTCYGHTDVRVLHGGAGSAGWRREGPTTVLEIVPGPTRFAPRPTEGARCGIDELLTRLEQPGFQVLDARSQGEYLGAVNEGNRRAATSPGPSTWSGSGSSRARPFRR